MLVVQYLLAGLGFVLGVTQSSAQQPTSRGAAVAIDRVQVSADEAADIERVSGELRWPWSMAFLPDGSTLVVEKYDGIRRLEANGTRGALLLGLPENVLRKEDSGYLDIALDPDFAKNGHVYLAFAEGDESANRTAIWKARWDGSRFNGGRVIFRTTVAKKGPSHPGGRILFMPDQTLLLSVGDGYDYRNAAQDLGSHLGKLLRVDREGRAPADNPFFTTAGALPEIWSSGHRNIQGLTRDPATGLIWAHEHGPRGGDEVNLITRGANYGWPKVTLGIDYDGKLVSERAFAPEFAAPTFFWAPSIAPSGIAVIHGRNYPDWEGKLLVGGLASRAISRMRMGKQTGLWVEEERMFGPLKTRIRDIRLAPDGFVYVLTDEEKGQLWRLLARSASVR